MSSDVLAADEQAMRDALGEARMASAHGDVPVGAVVVHNGEIIASRHNEREKSGDPTAHAEVLALRDAAARLGRWRLDDCTLYVTLEPCVMCAGALLNARIGRLVYGAADLKAGATSSLYNVCADPRLNHNPPFRHGVLGAECSALLSDFFAERR
ncbi:MAG: tRNA adenosine(34) deaminase TadA [Actinomycetota bacterium]